MCNENQTDLAGAAPLKETIASTVSSLGFDPSAPAVISAAQAAAAAGCPEGLASPACAGVLSQDEEKLLGLCRDIIRKGLDGFIEVGLAAITVRDRQLFRVTHRTFEEWFRDEYGLSARRARQLCAAAEIAKGIEEEAALGHSAPGFVIPANERQVRPLAALPAEERFGAWQEVLATARGRPVTERHVRTVVDARLGRCDPAPTPAPAPRLSQPELPAEPGAATGPGPGAREKFPVANGPVIEAQPGGSREDRMGRKAEEAVRELLELLDLAGTADSVSASGLRIALLEVEGFREHLSRMERWQRARRVA